MNLKKRLREDQEKAKAAFYETGERLNALDRQMAELKQEQSRVQGVFLYLSQLLGEDAPPLVQETPGPKAGRGIK